MASKKPKSSASAPFVQPETLVQAFRCLRERIPGFAPLSQREAKVMACAGKLDPEFVENGVRAAAVCRDIPKKVHRTPLQLASEANVIRRWDGVLREVDALMKGIAGANQRRKHRFDQVMLQIYAILSIKLFGDRFPEEAYLQPYYDKMKLAHPDPSAPAPVQRKKVKKSGT